MKKSSSKSETTDRPTATHAMERSGPNPLTTEPAPARSPRLSTTSAASTPARVLFLQRTIGNAAVVDLLAQPKETAPPSASHTKTALWATRPMPPRGRTAPTLVQRMDEDQFMADPPAFLEEHNVTVDMAKGLALRYPSPDIPTGHYADFVGKMDQYAFTRHWFVLQPNPEDKSYIVTPAIEKYIEHDPEWAKQVLPNILEVVKQGRAAPPNGNYIPAAYFPYMIGAPDVKNFEKTMGHTNLKKGAGKDEGGKPESGKKEDGEPGVVKTDGDKAGSADEFSPDFAFTGFMNGCALTVTPVPQDPRQFTIWHFQSSTANKGPASAFRQTRQPTDWFGEDEYYPREAEPSGITPKVTNFLFKTKGQWHVASQVNYAESVTGRIVKKGVPRSRPLNTEGGGDPVAMLKGIYVDGMQNAQNTRLRTQFAACRQEQKLLIGHQMPGMDVALAKLSSDIEIMLLDEEQQLRDAKDMATLHAVALGIRKNREKNLDIIKRSAILLRDAYWKMAKEEREKIFFKNEERRKAYAETGARLDDLADEYARDKWIGLLVEETAPRPVSSEEGEASSSATTASQPPPGSDPPLGAEPLPSAESVPSKPPTGPEPLTSLDPLTSESGKPPVTTPSLSSAPLHPVDPNPGLLVFLGSLNGGWDAPDRPRGEGDQGMIVSAGKGVLMGAAKSKDARPVGGEVRLPDDLRFLKNNGSGALCFIFSVVMGLTGMPQASVEQTVFEIAIRANAQGGWIAADSPVASAVIGEIERIFGVAIQVIELQNSSTGPIISGRSHNVSADVRRPIVIRNTGAHYDAVV
jgi:hypothetical protein